MLLRHREQAPQEALCPSLPACLNALTFPCGDSDKELTRKSVTEWKSSRERGRERQASEQSPGRRARPCSSSFGMSWGNTIRKQPFPYNLLQCQSSVWPKNLIGNFSIKTQNTEDIKENTDRLDCIKGKNQTVIWCHGYFPAWNTCLSIGVVSSSPGCVSYLLSRHILRDSRSWLIKNLCPCHSCRRPDGVLAPGLKFSPALVIEAICGN